MSNNFDDLLDQLKTNIHNSCNSDTINFFNLLSEHVNNKINACGDPEAFKSYMRQDLVRSLLQTKGINYEFEFEAPVVPPDSDDIILSMGENTEPWARCKRWVKTGKFFIV